jgi:hypothetical protein
VGQSNYICYCLDLTRQIKSYDTISPRHSLLRGLKTINEILNELESEQPLTQNLTVEELPFIDNFVSIRLIY